jgi:hypothetical protein
MKKILSVFIVLWSLIMCGCPADSPTRKAAKASFELSGITLDVVNATAKAYDAGIISLAVKDKMAAAEKKIAEGGAHFNDLLAGFIKQYPNGQIPADKLGLLNSIFSGDIVTPFLQILEQIKVLSPTQAGYLSAAISTLRTALLVIAGVFADAGLPDMRFTLASA